MSAVSSVHRWSASDSGFLSFASSSLKDHQEISPQKKTQKRLSGPSQGPPRLGPIYALLGVSTPLLQKTRMKALPNTKL